MSAERAPGVTDPGVTDPGVTDPGVTDPGVTDPLARDHRLLRGDLDLLAPVAGDFLAAFHDRLFAAHPDLRSMFPPDTTRQRERLLTALVALVTRFDEPRSLTPALAALGRVHARWGVDLRHYAIVGTILLDTLGDLLRPALGAAYPAHRAAWERAYTFAAGTMMTAAALDTQASTRPIPRGRGHADVTDGPTDGLARAA